MHSPLLLHLAGLKPHAAADVTFSSHTLLNIAVSPFGGTVPVVFAKTALTTTLLCTIVWLLCTWFTRPEPRDVLLNFYRKVRPEIAGWRPIAALAPEVPATRDLGASLLNWVLGCALVYGALFGVGKLMLGSLPLLRRPFCIAGLRGWPSSIRQIRQPGPDRRWLPFSPGLEPS